MSGIRMLRERLVFCVFVVRRSGRTGIDTASLARELRLGNRKTMMLCRALVEYGLIRQYVRRWYGVAPTNDEAERLDAACTLARRAVKSDARA